VERTQKATSTKVLVLCAPDGYIMGVWGPYAGSKADDKVFGKEIDRSKRAATSAELENGPDHDRDLCDWIAAYSAADGL